MGFCNRPCSVSTGAFALHSHCKWYFGTKGECWTTRKTFKQIESNANCMFSDWRKAYDEQLVTFVVYCFIILDGHGFLIIITLLILSEFYSSLYERFKRVDRVCFVVYSLCDKLRNLCFRIKVTYVDIFDIFNYKFYNLFESRLHQYTIRVMNPILQLEFLLELVSI